MSLVTTPSLAQLVENVLQSTTMYVTPFLLLLHRLHLGLAKSLVDFSLGQMTALLMCSFLTGSLGKTLLWT